MTTTHQDHPATTSHWDRGRVIGALVIAIAGAAWFGWAQQDPPSGWVPYLVTGSVLNVAVAVALVVILLRDRAPGASVMADPAVRRGYWRTVAIEVILIGGGNAVLGLLGHAEYDAAWTLFIVGAHFIPLGHVMHAPTMIPLGWATATLAVVAVLVALLTALSPSAAAGAGAGVLFLAYAVRMLASGLRR